MRTASLGPKRRLEAKAARQRKFPASSIRLLRDRGYDVAAVAAGERGLADPDVLALAVTENRWIITLDRDYGELIFAGGARRAAGNHSVHDVRSYRPDAPGRVFAGLLDSGKRRWQGLKGEDVELAAAWMYFSSRPMAQCGMATRAVEIGFAHPRDAPALALMSRELIEAGLTWAYRPERMATLIRDPESIALVARDHQHAAGFAVMRFGDAHAHLVLLAVHGTYQRRGIARQLLGWLTASAEVAGMLSIHVEMRARNHAAYMMYRRAGFAETFRIPGYYQGREDAVRMIRMLRAPAATVVPGSLGL